MTRLKPGYYFTYHQV